MNWNESYSGGQNATTDSGSPGDPSGSGRRALRRSAKTVAASTRQYLPSEYGVTGEVTTGMNGPQATVAVQPPVGPPISAGFALDEYVAEDGSANADPDPVSLPDDERDSVAQGLAARAAFQVKRAVGDAVTPTAR